MRIGVFLPGGFVFTPYKRKKYPELQKKSAGTKKIHAYRSHRLREWRLAPMLIKANPVKSGGKKQNKKPPRGETWRLIVKGGCLLRLRDY